MNMPKRSIIVSATIVLTAAPAAAQREAARDLGEWTVTAARDGDGCFATRTYDRDGATTLLLGLSSDGTNRLTVLNANWSIKPRDRLTLAFRMARRSYPDQAAIGIATNGKQGFVATFDKRFPDHFAASPMLAITRGAVPVERLPLDGSGRAVAELRRCTASAADVPSPRTDDSIGIPRDPFATMQRRRD
jgi:hypothetical protein